jgi:hypothetical protein
LLVISAQGQQRERQGSMRQRKGAVVDRWSDAAQAKHVKLIAETDKAVKALASRVSAGTAKRDMVEDRQTHTQTHRQTDTDQTRQTHRHTDRPDGQTHRPTRSHSLTPHHRQRTSGCQRSRQDQVVSSSRPGQLRASPPQSGCRTQRAQPGILEGGVPEEGGSSWCC